tara:strand:- start:598 stop:2859 length:2262 start_codon:yes stop_codon:yes gene_type:complete
MGIFKDFATSAAGDLTIGAFQGIDDAAQRDVVVNATASNNALERENNAYNLTETAFKNKKEIANILAANPEAFGLSNQEGLSIEQVADRFSNFMFLQNRSIFEPKDMDTVKLNVAKFMAANPGEGFTIYDPYISGEDRFKREQELHQARISEITKMPKADKLLMKVQKAEEGVATPESITDELTKVAALTAKGYGILNTFPTSQAGQKNLQFVQVNLITANAKAQFPDDKEARAQFINQKLFDNNINPADGIMYSSNINFQLMSNVIEAEGSAVAQKMLELTNKIAAAPDDETRKLLNDQRDQLVLEQHKIMDTYTKTAGTLMAGVDRSQVFPPEGQTITTPKVADGYVPTVNNEGEVVIDLANGSTQKFDLEMLVDFYTDSPENFKKLPTQVQNYVSDIADNLFVDGQMIEPKRNMFEEGRAGDKAFEDFTRIYNIFFPDTSDRIFDEVETLEPTEKTKLQKDDITKLKKDKQTGNEIKIEELPSADTKAPPKKPDQPEEPKEKSLQEKIKDDFPNVNVGTSGGDTTVEQGTKEKTNTQKQTEDVFEGSGVDEMFQSARFKFKNVDQGYLVEQWNKNYQTDNSITNRFKADARLFFGSNDVPADAAKQIDLVSSAFDGDNNFTKDQISEILSAIGLLESKYKYKKQGRDTIDDGKGVARSYWQIEPSTAESILDQNLNVMKGGGSPFLGANFEKLFRSKYADQIGSGTALEYFAKLNRKELSDLLLKDGLFAASMAAHKVITTFDPFNTKGA